MHSRIVGGVIEHMFPAVCTQPAATPHRTDGPASANYRQNVYHSCKRAVAMTEMIRGAKSTLYSSSCAQETARGEFRFQHNERFRAVGLFLGTLELENTQYVVEEVEQAAL